MYTLSGLIPEFIPIYPEPLVTKLIYEYCNLSSLEVNLANKRIIIWNIMR